MKNFITGLLVVIVIIVAIVLVKRFMGEDKQTVDNNQSDGSSLDVNAGLNINNGADDTSGDTLPQ